MDRAPTMPRDNAIFPEITLVITYVIMGSIKIVAVCDFVFIHVWPNASSVILITKPRAIRRKIARNLSIFE